MNTMSYDTVELAAKALAGNWRRFESFYWSGSAEIDDADKWGIVYTHHRDSTLMDQSNAAYIRTVMSNPAFEEDVTFESHNHWAVGHIDGFSIRVYDAKGDITPAFKAWYGLSERLADYPVLDDEDYSRREYEATLENIDTAGGMLNRRLDPAYILPDDWTEQVWRWIRDNTPHGLESHDDQGGWPSDKDLLNAFEALFEREPEEVIG